MGGRSSSSSSSTTYNQDKRVAVQDGVGVSGDSNSIGITTITNVTDGGLVSRGLQTVDAALSGTLETIQLNNATNAEGFEKLLSAAENLWDRGEGLIGQTQKAVADAWSQAQNDKAGTIDNRTVIVLAVAGAAALVLANRRK